MALMKAVSRNTSIAHRIIPFSSIIPLSHTQKRTGVTDSERFREVWHNTDSFDTLYQDCKKPIYRLDPTRRAHYYLMWAGCYGTGVIAARNIIQGIIKYVSWPQDVIAMSTLEVKLADVPEGKCVTVIWNDSPVFIWHRTAFDISNAERDDSADLRDPQLDSERVKRKDWLITMAVCTHLGCVPSFGAGSFNGFFCPCHGSHYDASGRIRKGPAPENLEVPDYYFTEDDTVVIGKASG